MPSSHLTTAFLRLTALAAVLSLLACAPPATAEQGGATIKRPGRAAPSAGEVDPRSRPHLDQPDTTSVPLPMAAIGIIESDDGFCTATMVTSTMALTAAHCLFDALGRIRVPERFRGGFSGEDFTVEALILRAFMPPGFDFKRFNRTNELDGQDWALVELADPVGETTGTVPVIQLSEDQFHTLGEGSAGFVEVGYGASDGEKPVVRRGCTVFELWDDNTFGHLCGTVEGDSGSPDLILIDGQWLIFGIESAEVDTDAVKGVDTAVSAEAFAPEVTRHGGTVQ